MSAENITAAVLVIGDEILSGRTKDKNIGYIAEYLTQLGIDLREVRVVPDVEEEIVDALNALRHRYTYVFTTGGIGPTHDDITADSVAKAFGVGISEDPRAIALMAPRYKPGEFNAARRRMTRIPHGAELVANKVSVAPGFMIGNVVTMAGVPAVMQTMLDDVTPRLKTGTKMMMETIDSGGLAEGTYGGPLGEIAALHTGATIGSYPSFLDGKFSNQIVVRSKDPVVLAAAVADVHTMIATLNAGRVAS